MGQTEKKRPSVTSVAKKAARAFRGRLWLKVEFAYSIVSEATIPSNSCGVQT